MRLRQRHLTQLARQSWLAAFLAAPIFAAANENGDGIRITGVTYLGDLPTVVADRRGLFADAGIDATIDYDVAGKRNLERLRAGETDFALMALTPLVIDALADPSRGDPDEPVILASLVHSTRLNQVVSLHGGGIRLPADLRDQRVGVMKGTNAEFVWWLFATYHGLDPAAVQLIDRPIEQLLDDLMSSDIDAAVLWEPWISRLNERLGERLRLFPGSNIYTAKWVLVTNRQTATQRSALCGAILRGYQQAVEFIERQPHEAMRMYVQQAGVAMETLRDNWQALEYQLSLDWTVIATLQQQLDWASRVGYPVRGGSPAVLSLIAPGPLRSLVPEAVSIPVVAAAEGEEAR